MAVSQNSFRIAILGVHDASIPQERLRAPMMAIRELLRLNIFSEQDAAKLEELRQLRNKVTHRGVDFRSAISRQTVADLRGIVEHCSAASPSV